MGCKQEPLKFTIATAANMQYAMPELTKAFTDRTGIECQTILGSSGKLTAQINEGAPFDFFIAANMNYPNTLHENGHTTTPPKTYAYGQLVLWSMKKFQKLSINLFTNKRLKQIAIANPKTAPYGKAMESVLAYYGILDSVRHKLVYGENIAQTNQFILSEAVDFGFTAKSVVLAPQHQNKGKWNDVPLKSYRPIAQGMVILNHRKEQFDVSQQFYNFMLTDQAKIILKKFGYITVEEKGY